MKGIFKIDHEQLLDIIDEHNHHDHYQPNQLFEDTSSENDKRKDRSDTLLLNDEFGFAKTINNTLFESHEETKKASHPS